MFLYLGRLNYEKYAVNELISVIFPGEVALNGEPAIAIWEWTTDAEGEQKSLSMRMGKIDSVRAASPGKTEIEFLKDSYYWFKGTFQGDDL
ncbi:hypothetical protein EYZ11_006555 [Aspergillus tanneri]|nr:hypothetical protein EYZ11_006555 [Aspergillus tanneri]